MSFGIGGEVGVECERGDFVWGKDVDGGGGEEVRGGEEEGIGDLLGFEEGLLLVVGNGVGGLGEGLGGGLGGVGGGEGVIEEEVGEGGIGFGELEMVFLVGLVDGDVLEHEDIAGVEGGFVL
ncbi:hypothetical protein, partial [Neisseria sicca]|uniref:hypothetical protein n=1 Tax=Neisseria sicca TaxID=490 RepID=UPI001C99A512